MFKHSMTVTWWSYNFASLQYAWWWLWLHVVSIHVLEWWFVVCNMQILIAWVFASMYWIHPTIQSALMQGPSWGNVPGVYKWQSRKAATFKLTGPHPKKCPSFMQQRCLPSVPCHCMCCKLVLSTPTFKESDVAIAKQCLYSPKRFSPVCSQQPFICCVCWACGKARKSSFNCLRVCFHVSACLRVCA